MTALLLSWLPYLCIAAIPGLFNILVAFGELAKECRFLPFFEPARSTGVWLWAVIQFSFPAVLFWFTASLFTRPDIDAALFVQALGFGFGFVAILNARTDIASVSLNIKGIYAFFVGLAYQQIAANQTRQAAIFWTEVGQELSSYLQAIPQGLKYLENYFESDISLPIDQKARYRERLDIARNQSTDDKKVEAVVGLMKDIRRKDLSFTLKQFGFPDGFIKRYFKR